MKWLTFVGLWFDLAGAVVMALGVIASRQHIKQVTATISGFNPAEQADRARQSNLAITGLVLLSIGFLMQIVASWPR